MIRTEVLVIGGGPAGATAARVLSRAGVDTLLVERDFSFVKPCGGGIPSTAFQELEIPDDSVVKCVNAIRVVSPKGETLNIKLSGGSIVIVARGDFDHVLRREAANSGARLLEAEFSCFEDIGKTVTARLALHDPEDAGGRKSLREKMNSAEKKVSQRFVSVEADYVIAADGANSKVRSALKIGAPHSILTLSEKIKGEDADVCEFWFGSSHAPRCYSWVFPQKSGVSAGTGAFEPVSIRTLWQQFLARRGLRTDSSARGYRIPIWEGNLYNSGRILFAGDAAAQAMPFTFEGIYYSMKSGEMAAMAIVGGKVGDYRRMWEKRFLKRFTLMKRLWVYFLRSDYRAEKIVQVHRRPEVQSASMALWLRKDPRKGSLLSYIHIFRRFLK